MIWGVDGGNTQEEILKPLGLYSNGGSSRNGKMTYFIYKISDGKFFYEIECDKIKDIYKLFKEFQRKDKILKIKNRIKILTK